MSDETKDKVEETTAPAEETKKEENAAPVVEEKGPVASSDEVEEVEVPAEFKKIVDEIEKMSVLDLNKLVKVFEKKFGVSAAAVAVAGPGAGAGAGEEKSSFDVELAEVGPNKIAVIKVVKEVMALGLKEAKDLVESAPAPLKQGMKKEEAEELKKKIEDAGGKVTLK